MNPFGDLLGSLAAPPMGRNRRISSNEQPNWNDGNFDMTRLAPGEVFELPVLEGPGYINHIWFTSHAGGMGELDALSLRIYWDGREEPGVEAPVGIFFAVGQQPAVVESVPVQVSPSGSLTCYWRMPFARSARIVVANDNPDRSTGLYWQVDWVQLDSLPPETPCFHARYRQEYPAVMGRDYEIADIRGSGRYVGTVLAVTMAQDGWFGEGDDFFYIDGEEVPSLQGTGTEDYFNDAWGFRPRTGLWFGQPRWQGYSAGDSGVCYRWHVMDPVGFRESLKVTIEHKGNREESEDAWYIERPDFLSSVAFWYQAGEPAAFGCLPGWPERCVPWISHHVVRSFRSARAIGGTLAIETFGMFGGRPMLAWRDPNQGATLSLPFVVEEDGRYAARLTACSGPDSGHFTALIDGNQPVDLRLEAAEAEEVDVPLGTCDLAAGDHELTLRCLSSRCSLRLEQLRLLQLPPEAVREPKTFNEAHFIRLGIGRACYAYRLAHDKLPSSLQQLVDCDIMPARYLLDENGFPLESRVEDARLIVRSTAPGGWEHAWSGLDARR